MKFLFISVILSLIQFDSPDCNMERGEVSIYRKKFKDIYFNRITDDKIPSGKILVEFGFGFGDDIKASYKDSVVFEDKVQLADRPKKGFVINVEKKKIAKIYFQMLQSKVCSEVVINSKYRMLYVTRFKNVWYFTYTNYTFPSE